MGSVRSDKETGIELEIEVLKKRKTVRFVCKMEHYGEIQNEEHQKPSQNVMVFGVEPANLKFIAQFFQC